MGAQIAERPNVEAEACFSPNTPEIQLITSFFDVFSEFLRSGVPD
jgi:hypothetical protein